MVMPERETPGASATAWATPMPRAPRPAQVGHRLVEVRGAVGDEHDEGEGEHQDADQVGLAELVLDEALEGDADKAGRDGADEQQPGETLVGGLDAAPAQAVHPGAQDDDDLAPEVDQDGDERAEVQGDVEGLVEVGVELKKFQPNSHGTRMRWPELRDRQELGEPLDDAQDEGLQAAHGARRRGPAGGVDHGRTSVRWNGVVAAPDVRQSSAPRVGSSVGGSRRGAVSGRKRCPSFTVGSVVTARVVQYDVAPEEGVSWTSEQRLTAVLADGTRYRIYRSIVERPGVEVTVADVAERFELHPNVARMHLTKLEQAGPARHVAAQGRQRRPPGPSLSAQRQGRALAMPPRRYDLLPTSLSRRSPRPATSTRVAAVCRHVGRRSALRCTSPSIPSTVAPAATSWSRRSSRSAKRSACCPR